MLPLPKKCYFHSPLYGFSLTMMSQIESIRSSQYTPLYENDKFERDLSQLRLLVLSCALFWRTKTKFVRNLVPKIATTKGISKPVSFCVHVVKSPYK